MDFSKDTFLANSAKYNYPEGRYNYYPRITSWNNQVDESTWMSEVKSISNKDVDIYIHIPFCTKFCFFCGCNIKASSNEELYESYIQNVISEWKTYQTLGLKVKNIFFGGGTPNSLSIDLFKKILSNFDPGVNLHVEYDPRFHDLEIITFLKNNGLKTISLGLQDLKQDVLQSIGRPCDLIKVEECLNDIKNLKLDHVNVDFIYGLPKQDEESASLINDFFNKNSSITGISLFPFAEVPWFKEYNPNFRKELLNANYKSLMHYRFSEIFAKNNFELISFGHYVKKGSLFSQKFSANELSRNIMGFNIDISQAIIGLGVSAISSTPKIMKQNHKIFENYMKWPTTIYTGHVRNEIETKKERDFLYLSCKKSIQLNSNNT